MGAEHEKPKSDDAFDELVKRRAAENESRKMYAVSGIGFEFVAEVGGLALLGWWLDRSTGRSPLFTLIGVALGFTIGLYRLVSFAKKQMK